MQKGFNGMQGCLDAGSLGWLPKRRVSYKKTYGEQKDGKKTQQDVSLQNDHRFLSGGRKEMGLWMIYLVEIQAQFCSEGGPYHFVVLRMVEIIFL